MRAMVCVVKLCLPVSHLEISESRLLSRRAKSFWVSPLALRMRMRPVAITCYNEITKGGICGDLLITCDFLGGLEKKTYFCNPIKRLKGEDYGIRNKKHSCSYR